MSNSKQMKSKAKAVDTEAVLEVHLATPDNLSYLLIIPIKCKPTFGPP